MTKILLAAMMCLMCAGRAWGFSNSFRVAGGNVQAGSQVYESAIEMDVLRCPSSGCATVLHGVVPWEITTPYVRFSLNHTVPDISPVAGNIKTQVCIWAVPPGKKVSQIPFATLSCSQIWEDNITSSSQWDMIESKSTLSTILRQADGTDCTPGTCAGAELYIVPARLGSGTSSANDDMMSLTVLFDQ